ncbi:MAG: hypothetical protein HZB92_02960 [Euryarchaeota archaeon]|nr:hypothetical protein [Euryarchaeota archaeon]
MSYLLSIIAGWMLVFGLVLAIVAIVAYKRASSKRLLMVAGAFIVFLVKGIFLALYAFDIGPDVLLLSSALDLAILTLLAFSVLKP